MKKNTVFIILFSLFVFRTFAADKLRGYVYNEKKEPLSGANVYWEESLNGTFTDAKGFFELESEGMHKNLIVSHTGFSPDTIHVHDTSKELGIVLKENLELQEVVVSRRSPGTITQRSSLLQSQKITIGEIHRAACCNLGESFETNPSVDVAYADAATGAKQIKLLGLSGTYVQMLTENYPNFRGISAPFGMDYIPGAWLEGIYISKGTSSVKNGYEAIAGQINVEYKKPQTADILSLNLFANDAMRVEANADASWLVNDKLSSMLFLHYSRDKESHDRNADGFLDYPKTEQFNVMNRWGHEAGKYVAQYGLRFVHEVRGGGQDRHTAENKPYMISLNTNRGEFYTKQAYVFNADELPESVAMIASGSVHNQRAKYDATPYDINQKNLYITLLYEKNFSKMHNLSTGLSLNHDGLDESLQTQSFDRSETVTGGYVQYAFNLNDKLILQGGVRADYSSQYRFFVTPRLHVKYNPAEWFAVRASVGKGYRSTPILAENNYLLASSRKIYIGDNLLYPNGLLNGAAAVKLDQEEALNSGVNATFHIPIGDKELIFSGEWYYTKFLKQVVVDVDSDPHAIGFYNLNGGKSYSNSAQVEASYPFFDGFTFTAAYRHTQSKTEYRNRANGKNQLLSKPLLNDYKALLTASYQTPLKKWQFDLTSQFNGGGRMPTPDATNPLWDVRFKPFTVLNSQITKFFHHWAVYAGFENLLDFRQKNPIIDAENPHGEDFDATMVWGPVHGRKIYVGMRWNIPKY
ncbi:MAG: TonB-dependent receptor [Dysgonamonadaceae bacterium]|jgi:outer membrane receptor for ferrienterochelin and colicin|nr:TonB-dependent receptor [Dysgonamonadaceae bacterium]